MANSISILELLCTPRKPDAIVGWRGGNAVCFTDFYTRVTQWRNRLAGTAGENVALFFHDSIEFAAALFGAWHAGKTVYLPSDTLPATCESLRQLVHHYVGDFTPDCAPLSAPTGDHADCSHEGFTALDPQFIGLVVFTSGSTGAPQAIPKKLSQLAAEVVTLEALFGKGTGGATVIATVSHQHIYGLLFKVLRPLACASPIQAHSVSYPEQIATAIAERECILVTSPAHLKRLPDSAIWAAATHMLRAVFSSGGPLSAEVAHATARRLGQVPVEVYGSSETGGIAWRQRTAGAGEEWLLMPGTEARIDEDDRCLVVRSPHLPDSAWFRCADRASMVDEHRFTLHGRADRIVKIEEKRISLDQIESRLLESGLVTEARAIVVASGRDRIAAFIVLSDAGRAALTEGGKLALNLRLRDWLGSVVERVALPRSWRYLDALPVNAQGKTTQAELATLIEDDAPHRAGRPTLPHMRLAEIEALRVLVALEAQPDLACFDGHFPQVPVVPGVAQVDWVMQLAREYFALPSVFCGIHALKFQRVIRPAMPFSLEMLHDPRKNSVSFRFFSKDGAHASGQIMFGDARV